MVKSVKAAMDALQEWSRSKGAPVEKFVVTGASKRGWTTWLTGSLADPRVVGIAPAVFDNLDFVAQLERQKRYWGGYSPMIADYTDRGLQELLGTERGKKLIQLVDPIHSLPETPTLVVTATNDAYWTVDSAQVYWSRINGPKWSLSIPNAPHTMGDKSWWAPTIAAFAAACVGGGNIPEVSSSLSAEEGEWRLGVEGKPGPVAYKVWCATSSDLHFDQAVWSVVEERTLPKTEGRRAVWVTGDVAKTLNTAVLVELEFETPNGPVRLTTPVWLVPKR
jgi:PhoPQ-activated pathogenicity-related protein